MERSDSDMVAHGWKSGFLEPCHGRDTRFSASGPKGRSISKRVLLAAINGRSSTVALSISEWLKVTVHALVSANA